MSVRMFHPDHGEMDCYNTAEVLANEGRGWVKVPALVAKAAPAPIVASDASAKAAAKSVTKPAIQVV